MVARLLRVASIAGFAFITLPAQAATYTWTGLTDTLWTTTTNWNPTAAVGGPTSADSLVFNGSTNATVDLEGASRTVTNIAYTGMTLPLTVTATNGSLTINGGNQSFGTQANGSLVTDYSGLSAFTYTQSGNNTFDVRMTIPSAGPTSGTATLRLATQGSGTNFIRAGTVQVGAAAGTSNGTAWRGVLGLGNANTFHATNFNIGGFNGSGSVAFQSGVTNGTLVLRGTGGLSTRVTTMDVGFTSSGTRDGSGTLDLTGGTLDALVATLTVGRHGANANNGPTSSLTMPGGSLDTTTLILGEKSNTTGTPTITSTFSQLGGSVVTGTMRFGNITASGSATTPIFTSIYNLSSGTLRAGVITSEPSVTITATTTSGSTSVRRIAWSGGTISNYDAATDLTISGTSTNAGYTMQLVLGSTTTPQVFSVDTGRTITVGPSAVISGTGSLQKQGAGTLRLSSANTYAGSATLSAGIMRLGIANGLSGNAALIMNPSSGTATLDLAGFSTSAGSLSSSGAGESIIDVASTGTSTLTVGGDNASTTFAGRLRNSGAASRLSFTKNGTGTLTLSGTASSISGALTVNNGKVTVNPGAGGSFATGRLVIAPGAGISATTEILSGSNTFANSAGISGIGDNSATGTSTLIVGGGSTTMQLGSNRFLIGNKGPGTLSVAGGLFTISGTSDVVVGGDEQYTFSNASGFVTVSGGTLSITGTGNLFLGRNGTTGTSTTGANGTITLDGGVFATARPITVFTGTNPSTGTVNLNGGTLRALASSTNFISVTTANVQNGGAVIDTNAFDVTIGQALQNAGSGGLTKVGLGTLTLTASNSYAGSTAVNGGTLKAGSVNAFGGGAITVANGATLDLNAIAVGNAITNNGGTVSNAASYAGSQTLTGSSTFGNLGGTVTVDNGGVATFTGAMSGSVTVNAGGVATVASAGSVAGGISVASTGLLGGSGIVGAISGAGLVGPGNSPGILTSTGSLDPSGGLDFSFEFGGTSPTWAAASTSVNDVLHLTAATPLTAALSGSNTVNVYLNAGALAAGNTFLGGIFIDQASGDLNLNTLVASATFEYFVAGGSDVTYNGVGYFTLANYMTANPGITGITASTTTVASADFATGTVTNGQVMQFAIVPEPGAMVLVATGALAAGWTALRRIRRR